MRLQGRAIGVAERDRELLGGELHILGESNAGEVEAAAGVLVSLTWGGEGEEGSVPDEPDEAFSGDVLLGLEFIDDEVLEGLGFERGGELAVADFLVRGKYLKYLLGAIKGRFIP